VHLGQPIFLFLAAFFGGLLNSVAGGGSFITFPALVFVGIPPIAANATNTAALWPGTLASTFAYRKEFTREAIGMLPALGVTGVSGGILGARILLITPQATFMRLVPWFLLGATLLFTASGPITGWVRRRSQNHQKGARYLFVGGLFFELLIAIYIGYFGAGVGILLLALLAVLGMENIHTMNGLKTLLVGVVNGVALVVFIWSKVVVWPEALLMLVGASFGGYGGAYFAQKMNPQHVRWLVIVTGLGISTYFFIRH
jgi:uncharacterized membrane protein YfcA